MFIFMKGKSKQDYADVFNAIFLEMRGLELSFQPREIMSDFEGGLEQAVSECFPFCWHRGCYFHFSQAIWRKVQKLNLAKLYKRNDTARLQIRRLFALAFVPVGMVRACFDELQNSAMETLQPLFNYFRRQWIERIRSEMWNVCGVKLRTNNHCEGWHNRLNNAMRRHRPNIWHCLATLCMEQTMNDIFRLQILAGAANQENNAAKEEREDNFKRLKDMLENGMINVFEYVNAIAVCIG